MIQFQVNMHLKCHLRVGIVHFSNLNRCCIYWSKTNALRLISAVDNVVNFQAKLVAVDLENETIQVEVEKQQVLKLIVTILIKQIWFIKINSFN